MTRRYPSEPLVGVGVVVFNDEKKVILVKRGNEPNKGLWAIPGGKVKLGEKVSETAHREVKEECNVHIELRDILGVVDLILKDSENNVQYHYILIDYLAQYKEGNLYPQSDVTDVAWFSQTDLNELDIPELTLKILEKAFNLI